MADKIYVLDAAGVSTLAKGIFQTVENNYIRRSVYKSELDALKARIEVLEASQGVDFSIESTSGHLILDMQSDENVDLSINESGNLILNSNDTPTDKQIAKYHFDINESGNLIATL